MRLPRFYPIIDAGLVAARGAKLREFTVTLRDAGVTLLQYRNKSGEPLDIVSDATMIAEVFAQSSTMLILNDRADLTVLAEWDGVHVGQEDLSPHDARTVVGESRY